VAANGGGSASSAKSEQQRIRELYQRLYPEAVKAQSGNALQASFDQWLEQVLATHVKQQQDKLRQKLEAEKPEKQSSSSSHKSTQSNNNSSSNHNNSTHNNISSNNSSSNSQSSSAAAEQQELHKQNLQLRECNDKLTQLVTKNLLNKQQDMPSSHSEWSDDICQKLKRQLEEKEKLLAEEQEASIGIQAKLRELRQEVNTERAQMHARNQAYVDKLQSKEQELTALNQELSSLNDKLTLERQQLQVRATLYVYKVY